MARQLDPSLQVLPPGAVQGLSPHPRGRCGEHDTECQQDRQGGLPRALPDRLPGRDADLRLRAPRDPNRPGSADVRARTTEGHISPSRDPRLPVPGTLLAREFRGRDIVVKVLDEGFEFEDRRYQSLSAIAKDVTGSKWNGFLFFGIAGGGGPANGHTHQGVSEWATKRWITKKGREFGGSRSSRFPARTFSPTGPPNRSPTWPHRRACPVRWDHPPDRSPKAPQRAPGAPCTGSCSPSTTPNPTCLPSTA